MDGEITPEEVEELLDGENPPRVVDIRSPAAFDREHISGSENIPFAELPNRVEALADADRIVTVCPHGQASQQAARLIKSYEGTKDARVESMKGGLTSWTGDVDSARPTESDEGPQSPF
ncbi:rhodanese-like domain-containing protein [Haloprofundus sp. MHR1]|uniref:rhodanese-like domain-containing protein n=1 Tax=Haloprofundus sp. MHR1 TaxID=2572921 RepID=UPI0010BEF549|nr:rhodanese-like domain-containing protein [Haloprofundus sp. MHR1]QCJ45718.1 rhodanese-like domain-containing protein [Haloprofundus sp. MHR1]